MTILDLDIYAKEHGCATRESLIFALRQEYASAQKIVSLVTTELRAADPALVEYCDKEMAWFFDDLGNCFYDCWTGVRQALENGTRLSLSPTTGDLRGAFAGLPAIVLGAGPGVNPRWDMIKASRGRAVLIVCDVMLEPCLARGIIPDFVSAIERVPAIFESVDGLTTDGITLLAPPVVEKRLVDCFGGRVIWSWRGCGLETWIDDTVQRNNFGRSCGTQGVGVALLAGCSPVYLVGHDLCMEGDKTHCDGAQAGTALTSQCLDQDEYHIRTTVKSISGRDVQTIHLWGMYKADIEYVVEEHARQVVINTGDGIHIQGTRPGELPREWGPRITIPEITRANPGHNPAEMIDLMMEDMPWIEMYCRQALEMTTPDPERLRISRMVDRKTVGIWTEIYGSTYVGALIRLHLQPNQHLAMMKRVANTIIHTLPHIRKGLDAILHP